MLNLEQLENLQSLNDRWQARCPACSLLGMDKRGVHLSILKQTNQFCCVAFQNDHQHRSEIYKLVGIKKNGDNNGNNNHEDETKDNKLTEPKQPKIYDKKILNSLLPIYDFYLDKGISKETLQFFQAGYMAENNKLKGRICFPIFNENDNIIGFAGRQVVENDKYPKWLLIGSKKEWVWPSLNLTKQSIRDRNEIVLIESLGNGLACWNAGIKNFLVLFGTQLFNKLLNVIIALNARVILTLDNDEAGLDSALKIEKRLLDYLDKDWVKIIHPPKGKKDLMECTKEELKEMYHVGKD
ncbi:MAG: toprim domain-containing protein [Nanoarchaeota archaeon]